MCSAGVGLNARMAVTGRRAYGWSPTRIAGSGPAADDVVQEMGAQRVDPGASSSSRSSRKWPSTGIQSTVCMARETSGS